MNTDQNLPQLTESILTLGSFDGLHLGHRYLIREIQKIGESKKLPFYLISFEPHPRLVLKNNEDFKLLQTWEEKTSMLRALGVENTIAIPFTQELSQKSAEEFILEYILKPFHPKIVVLGFDHKFGKNRQGSKETFISLNEKLNLNLDVVQLEEYMNQRDHISSTLIRQYLQNGDIQQANALLGYSYTLTGRVVEGKKLGRTIGFPTANITPENIHKLVPAIGVYATTIVIDGQHYKAATNIGLNPTVEKINEPKIESFILDFEGDIYHKNVTLHFHHYLRGEKKYSSLDELKAAIAHDVAHIKNL